MLKCFVSAQTYLTGLLNRDDKGATAVEYGLLVGLIALVIIGAVFALGTNLSTLFGTAANSVAGVPGA